MYVQSWWGRPESYIIAADGRLQDSAGSRIGPRTARSKKGHTSLVIPPSQRDVHGDSHMLQTKTHRPEPAETHVQPIHTASISPVHLHWKVKTNRALQMEAAAGIMDWLGANGSSLADHPRVHWQPRSAELDDLMKTVLKQLVNYSISWLPENSWAISIIIETIIKQKHKQLAGSRFCDIVHPFLYSWFDWTHSLKTLDPSLVLFSSENCH